MVKTNPDLTGLRVEHDMIVGKFFFITKSFFLDVSAFKYYYDSWDYTTNVPEAVEKSEKMRHLFDRRGFGDVKKKDFFTTGEKRGNFFSPRTMMTHREKNGYRF